MRFEIGPVHRTKPHLLADLAELILAVQYEGWNRIHHSDFQSLTRELPSSSSEIDEEESEAEGLIDADKYTLQEKHLEDCWAQLEYRAGAFGDCYPFEVEGDYLELKPLDNASRKLYVFLLMSSRLRSFKDARGFPQQYAKIFAKVARLALAQLLPQPHGIAHIFDANSDDRIAHYDTDARIALRKLASNISELPKENEISTMSSSGDGGIDLVGFYSFADEARGALTFFAQCGAQEINWADKVFEAHPIRARKYFDFIHDPLNFMFIPLCYRQSTGEWVDNMYGCLLLDRQRITRLLTGVPEADLIAILPVSIPNFGTDAAREAA